MSRLLIDAMLPTKLKSLSEPVELVDDSGRVVGTYLPQIDPKQWTDLEPKVSDDELDRRAKKGGGRSLADILRDLEQGK